MKTDSKEELFEKATALNEALYNADAVIIGVGSGLSTSAGFTYSGKRFDDYFADFEEKFGFNDMYSGGFYPYETLGKYWAFWSRYIYINRYMDPPKDTYQRLLRLVKDREYFVLTTNVDHCFQKAGFDKNRLFYTQGDYGLWQCSTPCRNETYDNEEEVRKMLLSQGFDFDSKGRLLTLQELKDKKIKMTVPESLIPCCPHCNKPLTMNLRADDSFVEDEGWTDASSRYEDFLNKYKDRKILYLELGVGANTPGIIKYPFWNLTYRNKKAVYCCINYGEAMVPSEIKKQSICINADIDAFINMMF